MKARQLDNDKMLVEHTIDGVAVASIVPIGDIDTKALARKAAILKANAGKLPAIKEPPAKTDRSDEIAAAVGKAGKDKP